ncbi:MAG: hypothetical protein Q7T07_06380 [Burkholderiaceae bacterium]|nr:hypothetical protein [Burkholderiaceae bacterium]
MAWLTDLVAGLLAAATLGGAAAANEAELPKPSTAQSAGSPELALHIQAALADAARRTGIDAAALKVASAERVTWLDGSLGCPEPDMMYTQALVPGYRIRIKAGGETLDYHAGTRGAPLLCPPARAVDPASERRSRRDRAVDAMTAATNGVDAFA